MVVGKTKPLTVKDLTPDEQARWEHIQDCRERFGLLRETDPPRGFREFCAELEREHVVRHVLEHIACLYLRDAHFRDRRWPTAVLITPGVWRQRLPVPPEDARA